jgi:hypothetical protein
VKKIRNENYEIKLHFPQSTQKSRNNIRKRLSVYSLHFNLETKKEKEIFWDISL